MDDQDEDDVTIIDAKGKKVVSGTGSNNIQSKKKKQKGPMDLYITPPPEVVVQNRKNDKAIGQHGPGIKPPSYHEVRVPLLKKELEHIDNLMQDHREEWARYRCTIMADRWEDKRRRCLINFLVNCPKGTMFIQSVDASSYSKTGEKMFDLLNKFVQQIGVSNVIQVVTDSASSNVVADINFNMWNIQLHHPLHAAGHFLNPEYVYSNPNIEQDEEVMGGLYQCIERLVPTTEVQDKISLELSRYMKADGLFGSSIAVRQRKSRAPADWWSAYGSTTPNLQKFAIKILILTCSASGCERNWNVFEHLHSKKRNRLTQCRLNDLVFIKINPIILNDIDDSNEWLVGVMDEDVDAENELVFEDDSLT
ncbi:uncharacterized protein LOC132314495 [Cornus florida]|uniref:uncharacterized protein LOC132314495 n=1 Tax=Cornus florida TaxID=4283 RepID=UPI00289FC0A5|nr:uncharacterized protein LOC132314495 [Cornus florida]